MTDRIADLKEVDRPGHPLHGQTVEVEPRNVTARWVTARGPDGMRYSLPLDWLRDPKPKPTVAMADPYFWEPDYNAALRRSVKVIASGAAPAYIAELEAKVIRLGDELARLRQGQISAEDREWAMQEASRSSGIVVSRGKWRVWYRVGLPGVDCSSADDAIRQLIAWRDEDRAKGEANG